MVIAAALDISTLIEGLPVGDWVAISEEHNRVVASGCYLEDAVNEAEKNGEAKPLIVRVHEQRAMLL